MPRLLREIVVDALSLQPDLEVRGLEEGVSGPVSLATAGEVDVLVLGAAGAVLSGEQERLLWDRPGLRILAIDDGGRQAAVYALELRRATVPEISVGGLAGTVRAACGRSGPVPSLPEGGS